MYISTIAPERTIQRTAGEGFLSFARGEMAIWWRGIADSATFAGWFCACGLDQRQRPIMNSDLMEMEPR